MILASDKTIRESVLNRLLSIQQKDFEAMIGKPVSIRLIDPPHSLHRAEDPAHRSVRYHRPGGRRQADADGGHSGPESAARHQAGYLRRAWGRTGERNVLSSHRPQLRPLLALLRSHRFSGSLKNSLQKMNLPLRFGTLNQGCGTIQLTSGAAERTLRG